jgi:hypothetical protein
MKKGFAAALLAVAIIGCHKNGGDGGGLPVVESPVTCINYHAQENRAMDVSIDPRWDENIELTCGLMLCETCGVCYYGCPPNMVTGECHERRD